MTQVRNFAACTIPLELEECPVALGQKVRMENLMHGLGILSAASGDRFIESLPFSLNDTTAGSENELQAVVVGKRSDVDLPQTIELSNYYANIIKRTLSGETPRRLVGDLERFLNDNEDNVWENSWVRFPLGVLSPFAMETFERDLLADKRDHRLGFRKDLSRFLFEEKGETYLRTPISYLIKLALADAVGSQGNLPPALKKTGQKLLDHFLSDNTSPETYSFHIVPLRPKSGMGRAIAEETSRRFLLTHLLSMYANESFRLRETGQKVLIYGAPHPPLRQKELNRYISDAFYRELFMSPCLSGWDCGEEKHRYMGLCHQVLSRSQLNAVGKLREAGIITRNLVVLPNVSNTSLANNGTHLSLGSIRLAERLKDPASGFGAAEEKYVGDLVIKIVEHFLPLFVNTYSSAPYRLDFEDLHPEMCLGFLPHELDYTHLRMIWRRWKRKMRCKLFAQPLTPFGPEWLDRLVSAVCRFKGDFVPDFRLIDYFVALMSTDRTPALDGRLGNGDRLKGDLTDLGVFDSKMALYMLYRLREFKTMGFSGFEGRHYSLFPSIQDDMARAADLQTLISALAFQYIAQGRVDHVHIPDTPFIESERRQIFFGAALGIPTFYIRKNTDNHFLRRIVEKARLVRSSRRYPGYVRVLNAEYRKALLGLIKEDASELIELMGLQGAIADLAARLENPKAQSAGGRLTRGILDELNVRSPFRVKGREFNRGAERYYRETLRKRHLEEAFDRLKEDLARLSSLWESEGGRSYAKELQYVLGDRDAAKFLDSLKASLLEDTLSSSDLRRLIYLVLIAVHETAAASEAALKGTKSKGGIDESSHSPVYRAEHG